MKRVIFGWSHRVDVKINQILYRRTQEQLKEKTLQLTSEVKVKYVRFGIENINLERAKSELHCRLIN